MAFTAEEQNKAVTQYRVIAGIQLVLGVGLVACGGIGTQYTNEYDVIPYYIGGFISGIMILGGGALCLYIGIKGADNKPGEEKSKEVACAVMTQYILSMFTFGTCIFGMIFAGMGSCEDYNYFYDYTCPPERDIIRYCIIVGIVIALIVNIVSMCTVCAYGKIFGVVMRRGHRGRTVMSIDTSANGARTAQAQLGLASNYAANTFQVNSFGGNEARMQQLARENELLQQNLELQRQLQQRQQQNTDPAYPPPPPYNYATGVNNMGFNSNQ